jgi:lysylphosphatidylglycerol synthetase-like protein (DUF2156 family)
MERHHIAEQISRQGNHASIALFDHRTHLFRGEKGRGLLGYHVHRGCAAVYGDPVCPKDHQMEFTKEFTDYADSAKLATCFVTASDEFSSRLCTEHSLYKRLKVGKELIVDTSQNPAKGSSGRGLKNRLNLARRSGVTLHEYTEDDPALKQEMNGVKNQWLNNRKGPQIFLSSIDLFDTSIGKQLLYAKSNGRVVGVLQLQQLEQSCCYLVQILMTLPKAPKGTSEALMMSAIKKLRSEGIQHLSLGAAVNPSLEDIHDFGRLFRWTAHKIFSLANKLFRLSHKEFFWTKFRPKQKDLYLISNNFSLSMLLALKNALNVTFRTK